jgi:type II secretory pathway predicted ATPase ExeA
MIQITTQFKQKVVAALLEQRKKYDVSDAQFAKQYGINGSVFSRLKTSESTDGLLRDMQWLNLGRELDVQLTEHKWKMAETDVFKMIREDVEFCQTYSKGKICVDDCGIGKTFSGKYLSRDLKNCFYVDASQAKTKQAFIRLIAKTIGVDDKDKFIQVKSNIKYALKMLPNPVIIIDEAGDLEYTAFLELKELWNATDKACGWYLMGADGLRAKIERGITNKKVGFAELFSRYSERYTTIVPTDRNDKKAFYKQLITDVLSVNMTDKTKLAQIVTRCLTDDGTGHIGGLRRAESLLILQTV